MVAVKAYTTQQMLSEIAALRGQLAHQAQNATFNNVAASGPITLIGQSTPAAPPANDGLLFASSVGSPSIENPSGQNGTIPATRAAQGGNTNNTTSMNAMFTPFSIPANDAQLNTAYRVTCGGHGTQAATTAVALNIQAFAFGQSWGGTTAGAGDIPAGTSFHWTCWGVLLLNTPGASAAASFFGEFTWSAAVASTTNARTLAMDKQVASGVNTTANDSITIQAGWASITGSPTLVCTGSLFERLGT